MRMNKWLPIFFAIFAFCTVLPLHAATKSEQVEHYLGTHRYKNERPKGTVKFVFQKAVLKRLGDGKKTYEQLLYNERYFSNRNNAGKLVSIQVVYHDKTSIVQRESTKNSINVGEPPATRVRSRTKRERQPEAESVLASQPPKRIRHTDPEPELRSVPTRTTAKTVEASTAASAADAVNSLMNDPVRPRQNVPPVILSSDKPKNNEITLPDSLTVVRNLEEAKEKITGWKGKMWHTVRPVWEFVMWLFSSLIVMLICFGGICRYVAKTAASESLMNSYGRIIVGRWIVSAHQNAAAMLLVVTWVIAIILLLDVFMWLVYLDLPIWTLLVIWFPILWVAEKLTSWLVPNIPVVGR
ncbi:MAG: hypothetical protein ACKVU2_03635 [Saprospiraceae bacterium]